MIAALGFLRPDSEMQAFWRNQRLRSASAAPAHGIGVEKKAWLSNTRSAVEIELKKKLEALLDPDNSLNPDKPVGQVVTAE